MKFYVLVEGRRTEKKIYSSWFGYAFPGIAISKNIDNLPPDAIYVISGNGYPSYLERIESAVEDVNNLNYGFDALYICIDAEEMSSSAKTKEIRDILAQHTCNKPCYIIVQDPCIESWFLGNNQYIRRNPQDKELVDFMQFYNVINQDPENMPCPPEYSSRAQFHEIYFKAICRDRGKRYTKINPGICQERSFLNSLVKRNSETDHISSIKSLLNAWRSCGSQEY